MNKKVPFGIVENGSRRCAAGLSLLLPLLLSVILNSAAAQTTTDTPGAPDSRSTETGEVTSLGGYGEIQYVEPEGPTKGTVDVPRFILFLEHAFNDDLSLFSEVEVEHTKVEGGDEGGEVALEQAYLQYHLSDRINVRAGLMVLPVGIINEFHEPPTFLSVLRPAFDHDVIPTTWREIGVGVLGRIPEVEGLQYRLFLTSGLNSKGFSGREGIREGRLEGAMAEMQSLAISGRLEYVAEGLRAGGWAYYGGSAFGNEFIGEGLFGGAVVMYGMDAQYNIGHLLVRGVITGASIPDAKKIDDAYHVDNQQPGGYDDPIGSAIGGGYVEVAYNVASVFSATTSQQLLPFARYEHFNTQASMPSSIVADKANDRTFIVAGIAYKPTYNTAVKMDWTFANDATDARLPGKFALGLGYNF